MKEFAFSRLSRLRHTKKFETIINTGNKCQTSTIVMWHDRVDKEPKQLGLMVSKKVGGAVRRNRIKRLLREAFRLTQRNLKEGTRLIIYPKPGFKIDSLQESVDLLDSVSEKARLKQR